MLVLATAISLYLRMFISIHIIKKCTLLIALFMTSAAMIKSVHFPCRIGKFCNPKGLFSKTAGFGSVVSRIESYKLWDRTLYIKHDHELFISGLHGDVCGNKIRKFKSLIEMDLPPRTIISCGGSQSNAMRALAAISHGKKARFIYLTRPIAKSLRLEPRGNLAAALKSGMELVELPSQNNPFSISSLDDVAFDALTFTVPPFEKETTLFVPQGGASILAESGVEELCSEIESFIYSICLSDGKPWKVLFASGTGTMSLFASRYFQKSKILQKKVQVVNIPCASSNKDMLDQLRRLDESTGNLQIFPDMIEVPSRSTSRFGKLDINHFRLWKYLSQTLNVPFDLLYAPRAFELLLQASGNLNLDMDMEQCSLKNIFPGHHLLYYHCGGLEGNQSQLSRYKVAGIE